MEFEVFTDATSSAEKENGVSQKFKIVGSIELNKELQDQFQPRTPLQDVRNKTHSIGIRAALGLKDTMRLDALDLQKGGTPKKQKKETAKLRRSCFASITPNLSTHVPGITLPRQTEEEPESPVDQASAVLGQFPSVMTNISERNISNVVTEVCDKPLKQHNRLSPLDEVNLSMFTMCGDSFHLNDSALNVAEQVVVDPVLETNIDDVLFEVSSEGIVDHNKHSGNHDHLYVMTEEKKALFTIDQSVDDFSEESPTLLGLDAKTDNVTEISSEWDIYAHNLVYSNVEDRQDIAVIEEMHRQDQYSLTCEEVVFDSSQDMNENQFVTRRVSSCGYSNILGPNIQTNNNFLFNENNVNPFPSDILLDSPEVCTSENVQESAADLGNVDISVHYRNQFKVDISEEDTGKQTTQTQCLQDKNSEEFNKYHVNDIIEVLGSSNETDNGNINEDVQVEEKSVTEIYTDQRTLPSNFEDSEDCLWNLVEVQAQATPEPYLNEEGVNSFPTDSLTPSQDNTDLVKTQSQASEEHLSDVANDLLKMVINECASELSQNKRLSEEFGQRLYKDKFETSVRLIRSLQAEKEELLGLMGDVEGAAHKQFCLRDALHKLAEKTTQVARKQGHKNDKLITERSSLRHKLAVLKVDVDLAHTDNLDLNNDLKNVTAILQRSNNSLMEVERLYEETSQDLASSHVRVASLTDELSESTIALEKLLEARDSLTQQLCESQDREATTRQALEESQEQLGQMDDYLEAQEKKLATYKAEKERVLNEHQDMISKMELYIENLQHTLDSWEQDRDIQEKEIDRMRNDLAHSLEHSRVLEREVKELREVKAVTHKEKEQMQELCNTNQFLEAEKQLYLDAITDYRTRLESEADLGASHKTLIDSMEGNLVELNKALDQMTAEKTSLECELASKTYDMDATRPVMGRLEEMMDAVLSAMQKKFNINVKLELAKDRVQHSLRRGADPSRGDDRRSFVSSVLARSSSELSYSARKSRRSPMSRSPKLRQSNVSLDHLTGGISEGDSGGSAESRSFCLASVSSRLELSSKKCLSFCEAPNSSRKRLFPTTQSPRHSSPPRDPLKSGFATIRTLPPTLNLHLLGSEYPHSVASPPHSVSGLSDGCRSVDTEPMLTKAQSMESIFSMVVRAIQLADRASELTIKDLREDLDICQNKLSFVKSEEKRKSQGLNEAQDQIRELSHRVTGLTDTIVERQEQASTISNLQEENSDLRHSLSHMEGERDLLATQLEEVIIKMDAASHGRQPEGACIREIVSLKKKNYETQTTLLDERKKNRELGLKAMKRMKILEGNWQKAEADVGRFDELVENIRQLCIQHESRHPHPAMLDIVRAIDGHEGNSGSTEEESGPMARRSLLH